MAEDTRTVNAPPQADRTERAAASRRVVGIGGNVVGVVALLIAIAAVAAILVVTNQGVSIGSIIEDDSAGTMTIAFPFLMVLLSMTGFFFGQFATRGRWGSSEKTSVLSSGSFRVDLRPISVALHILFLLMSVIVWFLVVAVPVL
ncbi:MAG: hypothetical protein ABWY57_09720, partial [Mycetocola sp.]